MGYVYYAGATLRIFCAPTDVYQVLNVRGAEATRYTGDSILHMRDVIITFEDIDTKHNKYLAGVVNGEVRDLKIVFSRAAIHSILSSSRATDVLPHYSFIYAPRAATTYTYIISPLSN